MRLLLIGGAGYIGSVLVRKCHEQGIETSVFDNLSNSKRDVIGTTQFFHRDARELEEIKSAMKSEVFHAVVFLCAEFEHKNQFVRPYESLQNSLSSLLNTLESMRDAGIKRLIFASSSEIYGKPFVNPVFEESKLTADTPFGDFLSFAERLLGWFDVTQGIKAVSLRISDVAGAISDGSTGESKKNPSTIAKLIRSALSGETFLIEGDDYETLDGTCVRDVVHVEDVAQAIILSCNYLMKNPVSEIFNISMGRGFSLREIIKEVEVIIDKKVLTASSPRKRFDPDIIWLDNSKAKGMLSWEPVYGLSDIIQTSIMFSAKNKPQDSF